MKRSHIDKLYPKIRRKYPDIQNDGQIEMLVRKHILRKKVITAVSLYVLSNMLVLLYSNIPQVFTDVSSTACENVKSCIGLIGGILCIVSVMMFAKALHNPLTPNEEIELQKKETYEKTGYQ